MSDIAIKVENLSKLYHIGVKDSGTLRETITNSFNTIFPSKINENEGNKSEFWALNDVSFEIKKGDIVGVIGRNGAGKSTLLKILSRITQPTSGKITINGRVGSLLEVGTGFHPELTGRENIYLNGSILGMRKSEITKKFDEIVEFSGVEKFIDTIVKRYSSGMYVRLAFSVAAHLEPEVMIVDEVLAVGDSEFQKKCLGKMQDVAGHGKTVLVVSHNMGSIRNLCKEGIYLKKGIVVKEGSIEEVIQSYLGDAANDKMLPLEERKNRNGTGEVTVKDIGFYSKSENRIINTLLAGSNAVLKIEYRSSSIHEKPIEKLAFGIRIFNQENQFLTVLHNHMSNELFENAPPSGTVFCRIPRMPLMSGVYKMDVSVFVNGAVADNIKDALKIDIVESDYYGSGKIFSNKRQGIYIDQSWEIDR